MTSSIQRIQAAISQANLRGQAQGSVTTAGQSLVCSFEIEGRNQEGYLGVHSIAEVTPPWFPKDAFQLRGRSEKPASPMITLKREPAADPEASGQTQSDRVKGQSSCSSALATIPAQEFLVKESSPVTAEVLAELFEQAASIPAPSQRQEQSLVEPETTQSEVTRLEATQPKATQLIAASQETAEPDTTALAVQLIAECEPAPSRPSLITPVSEIDQAAAQTLAQALNQSSLSRAHEADARDPNAPAMSIESAEVEPAKAKPAKAEPAKVDPVEIKPIETVARPALPRSKPAEFSVHQNSTNPMLPLELLQNIGQEVIVWQEALKAVHQKIQSLYQEGPILNGWLEKPAYNQTYLLCRLDAAGQSWRSPCHPADLQQTSLAIGRYKRLRSLLGEKQRLDQRIKRLSETLTMLRLRLRAY